MHAICPHHIIKFHFIFLVHQKLTTILTWSETFNVFSFNAGIVASNSTPNTVNICLFLFIFYPLQKEAFRRLDPQPNDSYQTLPVRRATCVKRNIEERSCNHCCCRKVINITYPDGASAVLSIQHAMRMRHVVISGLSDSTIFMI